MLFPEATGETCDHAQFAKGKGCVKDLNWELGDRIRLTLDCDGPSTTPFTTPTSTERINRQCKELSIKRPKVRNIDSIRTLNTLTCLVINARALRWVRQRNADLLSMPVNLIA